MTMRFVPTTIITTADGTLRYLFAWLDFMRTASPGGPGWTIPRSSNGTVGGGGDNIATFSDLSQYVATTSESWFVLRSPGATPIEYIFFRVSAADTFWSWNYSPGALYIGGSAGARATATDEEVLLATTIVMESENVLHMGADDAAPYGWYTYMHLSGALATARGAMARIPMTDAIQPGDTERHPSVHYYGITSAGYDLTGLQRETISAVLSRCMGKLTGGAIGVSTSVPALRYQSGVAQFWPDGAPQDNNSADVSAPIPFGRRSGIAAPNAFKGFSDFVQWNGVVRAPGETFATRTRVSWGTINFPWDGSVPSAT